MPDINSAYYKLNRLDEAACAGSSFLHRLHPAAKLAVCAAYIVYISALGRYDLPRLLLAALFPAGLIIAADLPAGLLTGLAALSLPFTALIGAFSLYANREAAFMIGGMALSYGALSFCTLVARGYLSLLMALVFSASSGITGLRQGLAFFRLPAVFTELVAFVYRYIFLLLRQASRLVTAYRLRSGGRGGIQPRQWGSLGAGLMVRSYDLSLRVHDCMVLRGYDGSLPNSQKQPVKLSDGLYVLSFVLFACALQFGGGLL